MFLFRKLYYILWTQQNFEFNHECRHIGLPMVKNRLRCVDFVARGTWWSDERSRRRICPEKWLENSSQTLIKFDHFIAIMRVQQDLKLINHMLESDLDNLLYLLQLKPANFRAIRYKLFWSISGNIQKGSICHRISHICTVSKYMYSAYFYSAVFWNVHF